MTRPLALLLLLALLLAGSACEYRVVRSKAYYPGQFDYDEAPLVKYDRTSTIHRRREPSGWDRFWSGVGDLFSGDKKKPPAIVAKSPSQRPVQTRVIRPGDSLAPPVMQGTSPTPPAGATGVPGAPVAPPSNPALQ